MVREILETIDNFLQPVHDWLMFENRHTYLPRIRDEQRFSMAELLEIYARISPQRKGRRVVPVPDPLPKEISPAPLVPTIDHPYFLRLRDNALRIMTAMMCRLPAAPPVPTGGTPQVFIGSNLPVSRLSRNK